MRRDIVGRSLRVGLTVGTILAFINHGSAILSLDLSREVLLKIGLTYLVPYTVSTWASVQTIRRQA
jgi:hypothetical protein